MKPGFRFFMIVMLVLMLATGCSLSKQSPTPEAALPSATPVPPTPEPVLSPTPIPTATEPVPASIQATVKPDGLNLRSGPSPLHSILGTYKKDDRVTILSRARGNQWVKVESQTGQTGWMYTPHLSFTNDLSNAPIEEVEDSFNVRGLVADQSGNPIEGISLALVPMNGNEAYRIDAVSDSEGRFYAYVPVNSFTSWRVSVVGVRCGSRLADANCNVSNYFINKEQMEIVLPQLDPIEFIYQQASSYITGVVKDWQGQPATDVRVFAVRTSDGARAWGSSQANGLFSLPVTDGVWEVYAVLLVPYTEGRRVTITITAGQTPEQIELRRP